MKHMKCITAPYCKERRFCITKYDMGCKRCKLGSLTGTMIPRMRIPESEGFRWVFEREITKSLRSLPNDFRPGRIADGADGTMDGGG
ncbi:MAG: hypothetical protein ACYDG6_06825 [Thermincolia bacterium]